MGRCKKRRCCRYVEGKRVFKPVSVPMSQLKVYEIEPDEFEALRLCDLENKSQIDASIIMKVSRATIQRLLIQGRSKLITALLNNHAIHIKNLEVTNENMCPSNE